MLPTAGRYRTVFGFGILSKPQALGKVRDDLDISSIVVKFHRWRDSCQKYHPAWRHMFWDKAAAEQLLEERYPWFLDTWRMYPRVVHRGGARAGFCCGDGSFVAAEALSC